MDILFFSTKYAGLEQAILLAKPLINEKTILCSFLNGISSETLIQKTFQRIQLFIPLYKEWIQLI